MKVDKSKSIMKQITNEDLMKVNGGRRVRGWGGGGSRGSSTRKSTKDWSRAYGAIVRMR